MPLIQSCSLLGSSNGGSSPPTDFTGCKFIIVLVSRFSTVAFSDDQGNSYTPLTEQNASGDPSVRLYHKINPTVGSTQVFTTSGGNCYGSALILGFSDNVTFDAENGAGSGSGTTFNTGSLTPNIDNELLVYGIGGGAGGIDVSSVDVGTLALHTANNGDRYGMGIGYQIQTTATARNPQFTMNASAARLAAVIAAFKVSSGIAFDAAANSGTQVATNTYSGSASWSGSDRMLSIDVSLLGAGTTVTSMTYGGASCTFIGSKSTITSLGSVECWRICQSDSGAPAAGINTLVVNLSSSISFSVEWTSYVGVHQTSPTEGFASAQATNGVGAADATVNVTTVADNDWVHAAVVANDDSITASQTSRNNISFTAVGSGGNEDTGPKTPAGSQTVSYTGIAALKTWAIAAYAIRPVTAASLTTFIPKQQLFVTQALQLASTW